MYEQKYNEFKHDIGCIAKSRVTGMEGVVTARSQNLYGCNRYFIQPKWADNKLPDGWWVDEDDVYIVGDGVNKSESKPTGGPMSRVC